MQAMQLVRQPGEARAKRFYLPDDSLQSTELSRVAVYRRWLASAYKPCKYRIKSPAAKHCLIGCTYHVYGMLQRWRDLQASIGKGVRCFGAL